MDGGPFPAENMQQISPMSAAEADIRRYLGQFAPHMISKLEELLQEERSRTRQQEYEMMYMQEEYQSLKDIFQQQQQVSIATSPRHQPVTPSCFVQDMLALKAAKDHAENSTDFMQQQCVSLSFEGFVPFISFPFRADTRE
jgi:hypothetical protein